MRVYIYLDSWYDDRGTDVVAVDDKLVSNHPDVDFADEVQVWDNGVKVEEWDWFGDGWRKCK